MSVYFVNKTNCLKNSFFLVSFQDKKSSAGNEDKGDKDGADKKDHSKKSGVNTPQQAQY